MRFAAIFRKIKALQSTNAPNTGGTCCCPICGGITHVLDEIDLNRSCEDPTNKVLPPSGRKIAYVQCEDCGHCHAPDMVQWPKKRFATEIYNDEYRLVDPDYVNARPLANASLVSELLGKITTPVQHLDYGGGSGLLSAKLREFGWNSDSVDPYLDKASMANAEQQYDLVTAFEVFEHVPDACALVTDLARYSKPDGLILFSTLLNDGQILPGHPLDWWYAAPRNGHITLFSAQSLAKSLAKGGFMLTSLTPGLHLAWKSRPSWLSESLQANIREAW